MKTITRYLVALALLPLSAQAQIIGYEPFDYISTIVDADQGVFWDFKNELTNRHTGQSSDWDLAPGFSGTGVAICSSGQLFTVDAGVIREYGGPNESEGAINDSSVARKVYYRINMIRGTGTTWCGVSSFDFGSERLFFGLYPGGANFGIYNQNTFTPIVVSTVPVNVGQSYTIVAKVDYAADRVSLYVNPNFDALETDNTPVATAAYTGAQWSTAIRVASGGTGIAAWDDLTCATTWESLRTYAVTSSNPTGLGSLQNATFLAGSTGGRITFPHAGAVYAVRSAGIGQNLIRFNRNQPGNLTLDIPITGLASNELVRGIDFRTEGNGQLYAMCILEIAGENNNVARLCTLNTSTGALTTVGSGPFLTDMPDASTQAGFDFEYRANFEHTATAIRVTLIDGRNLRLNPINGFLEAIDTPLTTSAITGIACDVWTGGEAATTVYGINLNTASPSLWRIGGIGGNPSADGGITTRIGALNLPTPGSTLNGFDISEDGKAYLNEIRIVTPGNFQNFLHTVDLRTGATTQIGQIGTGVVLIYGMSVASSKIVATNLAEGPGDTIIDGGSHGGRVRIGFSEGMNFDMNAGDAIALRNLQFESVDGIFQNGGLLTAYGCTFYRCIGGAINSTDGILKLNRCTFVENSGFSGGALRINSISAQLVHCTFAKNRSLALTIHGGGAILHSSGPLQLTACVVAENTSASGIGPDISRTGTAIITATACVIGDAANSTITETVDNGNYIGDTEDPKAHNLAPLANYGGHTWTMPPQFIGSTLNRARTTNFTGDQRGFQINGFPDSGAAEFRGNPDLALYWNTDWDNDGNTYGIERAVDTAPEFSDPSDPRNLRVSYEAGLPTLRFFMNPGARPFTRWQIKRSTDLINFSELLFSFDAPAATGSVAFGITNDSLGDNIILRDNPPNPARAFYRLEATLSP